MALLGIDFGTEAIRVVAVGPDGLPDPATAVVVPAWVTLGPRGLAAGDAARMTLGTGRGALLDDLKSVLGLRAGDQIVRAAAKRGGWTAAALHEDLQIETRDGPGQTSQTTLVHATAALLRYAADVAAGAGGHEVAIAVPHWLAPAGSRALGRAAAEARLELRRWVQDTVAVGLWTATVDKARGRIAVLDAGAGGLTISLLTAGPDTFRAEVTHSSPGSAGRAVDRQLATTAHESRDPHEQALVQLACEKLKRALVHEPAASAELHLASGAAELQLERWELELALAPVGERLDTLAASALQDAEWAVERIDHLIAAGGMTTMAAVAQRIEKRFESAPRRPNADLQAAACGAALVLSTAVGKHPGPTIVGDQRSTTATVEPDPSPPPSSAVLRAPTTRRKRPRRFRPDITRSRRRPSQARTAATAAGPQPSGDDSPPLPPVAQPAAARGSAASPPPRGSDAPPPAPATPAATLPEGTAPPQPPSPARSVPTAPASPSAPPQLDSSAGAARASASRRPVEAEQERSSSGPAAAGPRTSSSAPSAPPSNPSGGSSGAVGQSSSSDRRAAHGSSASSRPPSAHTPASVGPPRSQASKLPLPTAGSIASVGDARAVLGLAMHRPLQARDLEPVHAPVLLYRVLGRSRCSGTVHIEARGYELVFPVAQGNAALSDSGHGKLMRLFDLTAAQWRITPEVHIDKGLGFYPLRRVALTGLRRVLRAMNADDLGRAFGAELDKAPSIDPARRSLPHRLGVSRREQRFIESCLDGTMRGRKAAQQGGIGPSTALQVMALLTLLGALEWRDPPPP